MKKFCRCYHVIDRRIPKGKRDYAMIFLGAVTGLRAIDIVRLKLSDITLTGKTVKSKSFRQRPKNRLLCRLQKM